MASSTPYISSGESTDTEDEEYMSKDQPIDSDFEFALGPIPDFEIPNELGSSYPELTIEVEDIKQQYGNLVKDTRPEMTRAECDNLVTQLRRLTDQQSHICKRLMLDPDGSKRRKIDKEIDDLDRRLLKTRATFTTSMALLSDTLFVRGPHELDQEVYFSERCDQNLPGYPSAPFHARDFCAAQKRDGALFKDLLKKTYSDPTRDTPRSLNPEIWCPVLGQWIHSADMEAVHIVPPGIGAREYAYLNGLGDSNDALYRTLFSAANGLMLDSGVEKKLRTGRLVIVPTEDDTDGTNYECRILERDCLRQPVGPPYIQDGQLAYHTWESLDGRKLTWLNDNRPSTTNLFLRYIITRWARKRFDMRYCELDQLQIPRRFAWYGIKPLRAGVLRKLAYELGDVASPTTSSRSVSGKPVRSILKEIENIPLIPETEEQNREDSDVATRIAHHIVDKKADRLGLIYTW